MATKKKDSAKSVAATKPSSSAEDFEKLGVFYLGRPNDLAAKQAKPGWLLYDSKDLVTHAVCVGMTGSGKTGLGIDLLEEAAIDKEPVIALAHKGDMGTLLLTFPALLAAGATPLQANATSTVALVPGSASAFWAYRRHLEGGGAFAAFRPARWSPAPSHPPGRPPPPPRPGCRQQNPGRRAPRSCWLSSKADTRRPPPAAPVSYTHLRAHETVLDLVCRLLLEKKTNNTKARRLNSIN